VPLWSGAQQAVEDILGHGAKGVSGALRDLLRAVPVPGPQRP
jgi:hypothetical protein